MNSIMYKLCPYCFHLLIMFTPCQAQVVKNVSYSKNDETFSIDVDSGFHLNYIGVCLNSVKVSNNNPEKYFDKNPSVSRVDYVDLTCDFTLNLGDAPFPPARIDTLAYDLFIRFISSESDEFCNFSYSYNPIYGNWIALVDGEQLLVINSSNRGVTIRHIIKNINIGYFEQKIKFDNSLHRVLVATHFEFLFHIYALGTKEVMTIKGMTPVPIEY